MSNELAYQPHKLTDENLAFLKAFVVPCENDGYCRPMINEDTEPLDLGGHIPLRVTKDGRNYYNAQLLSDDDKKESKTFKVCLGCFHPIGSYEARLMNDYLGHKAPSLDEALDFEVDDEEIDLDF